MFFVIFKGKYEINIYVLVMFDVGGKVFWEMMIYILYNDCINVWVDVNGDDGMWWM